MNLEYFYNLIQLFGALLGLMAVFIVFNIQSLDTRINEYRNIIVTIIAHHRAEKNTDPLNQGTEMPFNERLSYYFFIYNTYLVEPLFGEIIIVINEMDADIKTLTVKPAAEKTQLKLFLDGTRDKWINLANRKVDTIASIKYPIIVSSGIILYGLLITTYYNFELVNNISNISLISLIIALFILFAFYGLICISKYIYDAVANVYKQHEKHKKIPQE